MTRVLSAFAVLMVCVVHLYADVTSLCAAFDAQIESLDVKGARQSIEQAYKEAPSS